MSVPYTRHLEPDRRAAFAPLVMGIACSRAPSEPAIQRTVQTVEASWSTARLAPAGSTCCLPPSAPSSSQESLCSVDDKPPRAEPAADSVDAAAESRDAAAESVEVVAVDGGGAAAAATTTVGDVEVELELEQVGEVEQVAPAASRDGRRSEGASSQAAASSSRPCLATLLPDPKDKHAGVVPAAEWEPLSDGELEVVRAIRGWLGEEAAAACPRDLLVTFTRGYAYRPDWSQASFVFLERALAWREEMGACGICFGAPPARRELFEELCPSGLIGHDSLGLLAATPPPLRGPDSSKLSPGARHTSRPSRRARAAWPGARSRGGARALGEWSLLSRCRLSRSESRSSSRRSARRSTCASRREMGREGERGGGRGDIGGVPAPAGEVTS